jgi:DNA-binding SARP family transcriptional activator
LSEFRVLGPVEAAVDGRPVRLPASKPRALLAVLLLNRNRVVATDTLIDALWEDPPDTAAKALQGYVSQVRREVGPDRLETKPPGYVLRVDPGELDLEAFEALAAEGRERLAAGDAETAAKRLRGALELWRGPPLAEFDDPFARESRPGLEEVRLATLEARLDADLARGRHDELVPELEQLVAREPYRERPRAQLMVALYRAGRQADALEVYRRTRETLIDELGIEPAKELQELEQAILRHDPVLDRPSPPPRLGAGDPGAEAPRRRLWAAGALTAVIAAALVIAFATTNGGSKKERPPLRPFVAKVENFLVQSRDGRREVASTLLRAGRCTLPRSAALVRLGRVQRNRQSLLDEIAALSVPDDAAAGRASDSLQRAIQLSIRADGLYSDWLAAARGCPPKGPGADLRSAHAADTAASRAKHAFVAVFDPLARRFGQEVWAADEF